MEREPDHRHAYFVRHPRNFGNEYTVLSCATDLEPEPVDRSKVEGGPWQRVSRDEALRLARDDGDGKTDVQVSLELCPCDQCAIAKAARKHPSTKLAARYRFMDALPAHVRREQRDRALLGEDHYRARWDPHYDPAAQEEP